VDEANGFHYNLINRVVNAFDFPRARGLSEEVPGIDIEYHWRTFQASRAEKVWVHEDGRIDERCAGRDRAN
jgi:hypothetical protein